MSLVGVRSFVRWFTRSGVILSTLEIIFDEILIWRCFMSFGRFSRQLFLLFLRHTKSIYSRYLGIYHAHTNTRFFSFSHQSYKSSEDKVSKWIIIANVFLSFTLHFHFLLFISIYFFPFPFIPYTLLSMFFFIFYFFIYFIFFILII